MIELFNKTTYRMISLMLALLSRISLRTVVLIIGVSLALFNWRPVWITYVDTALMKSSSYLFESPLGVAPITIVEIPEETLDKWQRDIHNAGELSILLANILHSSKATIGLIFNGPIDMGTGEVDRFLARFVKDNPQSDLVKGANVILQRKLFFLESLSNSRVVIGVENNSINGQIPLFSERYTFPRLPSYINNWLWPDCVGCDNPVFDNELSRQNVELFPILPVDLEGQPLFYAQENEEKYAGFLFQYYLQAVKSSNVQWQPKHGVMLEGNTIKASPTGKLYPLNTLTNRMSPLIERIPIEEALARRAFPPYIFITSKSNTEISRISASFYSLLQSKTAVSPWWFSLFEKILLVLLALYLFIIVAKVSPRAGAVATVTIFIVLTVFMILAMVTQGVWLPLGTSLSFLIFGFATILVWKRHKKKLYSLQYKLEESCLAQAEMLVNAGRMGEAGRLLLNCEPSAPVLDALYDYADTYAQKNEFDSSITLYHEIKKRKKNYKDIHQKIELLEKVMTSHGEDDGLDSTRVLHAKDPSDPSILGRYEVNQEIGRGAVGRVFLGFDPRIARNVAIKTLNYNQFQGKQLEEIKSRFFREAEAAGRLNHPNIVSVYDMGEQGNLAYIAMDYVEGKSLNQYIVKEKLLPVFEVYRIVCDVAAAMEYAHENNIVHRDIKPGNIMYSPSPYQLKVTDFGIARIVDDSKTSTGEILGSPLYMAPEQLKGKKVTRQADVFSLGVTFYQLLTGELPFKGDNLAALTYEIIHGRHKNIRSIRKELPASAARIVNQALQKDPADRYESAAEMLSVLKKAIKRDFTVEAKSAGIV